MSAVAYQDWMLPAEDTATLNRMVVVSVVLHVCLLLLFMGIRLTPTYEKPMSSYQVSLVSLSSSKAPNVAQETEQPLAKRTPELPSAPPPAAPLKTVKPMAPKVAPVPVLPQPQIARSPDNFMQDVLRGIEPPPEAPTLGAVKPAAPPKLRQEMDKLMQGLQVPKDPAEKVPEDQPRKSLSDDLAQLEPKVTAKAAPAPALKKPDTAIQVPGLSANWYLAQVQNKISSKWIAPPIDLTGASFRVTIRFRLQRNGEISEVAVETSSGNAYYDDAGRRAVLKAYPLPDVPKDMPVPLDVHFSFTVGEGAG